MEYQHQPLAPLGPPQLLPPVPPPPLPSLPQLQHGHAHAHPHLQDDDRWSQYHIWRQHVFVNGQSPSRPRLLREASAHFLRAICARCPSARAAKKRKYADVLRAKFSVMLGLSPRGPSPSPRPSVARSCFRYGKIVIKLLSLTAGALGHRSPISRWTRT